MLSYIKRFHVLIILMVAYTTMWIDKGLISLAIIPISHEYTFSKTEAGMLLSAYSLGYALISLPGGVLSDLFGYKKVILFCMTGAAVSCFFFPFSSILILFILIRFLLGVSHGSIPSASAKAIAFNYTREQRVMVQSVWFMSGSIGGCIAAWIGARLITIDWTLAYYAVALCYLISGVLILMTLKNTKQSQIERKLDNTASGKKKNLLSLLTDRNVLILAVSVFAFNLVLNGSIWFPSFLKQKFNLSLIDIGYIQSVIAFIGIVTPLLCGFLCSKIFNNRENIFILMSTIVTAICFLMFVLSTSVAVIVTCYALSMLTSMFSFITIKNLPHKVINEEYIGTSMGIITAISSFGGFVAPTLLGLIIDHSGNTFDYAYYTLAAIMLTGGIVCLFGVKSSPKEKISKLSSESA